MMRKAKYRFSQFEKAFATQESIEQKKTTNLTMERRMLFGNGKVRLLIKCE